MKTDKIFFTLIAFSVFLYFGYKISGKPAVAILAVAVVVIAGIYRLIYDFRHDSFPWKKTEEGKRAEAQHRMEKAQAKADRIQKRKARSGQRKVSYMERMTAPEDDDKNE